jgi:hypothetical protein
MKLNDYRKDVIFVISSVGISNETLKFNQLNI